MWRIRVSIIGCIRWWIGVDVRIRVPMCVQSQCKNDFIAQMCVRLFRIRHSFKLACNKLIHTKNDEIRDIPNTKTIPTISVPLNQNESTIRIGNSNSNSNIRADSIAKTKENREREQMKKKTCRRFVGQKKSSQIPYATDECNRNPVWFNVTINYQMSHRFNPVPWMQSDSISGLHIWPFNTQSTACFAPILKGVFKNLQLSIP